jgi:hypothetical protein
LNFPQKIPIFPLSKNQRTMKNTLTLSLCLLIALPLWAQKTRRSLVREQNSGKKAGEWVFLEDVQKSGRA